MIQAVEGIRRDLAKVNRALKNMLPIYNDQVTHYSCTDGDWSVTVFPDHAFPRSAGYFMHRTASDEAICPRDVQKLAGEEVVNELRALGRFIAWGN